MDKLNGSFVGNKSYTSFIKKHQPDVVLCGHIHENAGKEDKIGKSRILNPGPTGMLINL